MLAGIQGFALELKRARDAHSASQESAHACMTSEASPCDDASSSAGIGNTSSCVEKETFLAGVAGERSVKLDFLRQPAEPNWWSSMGRKSPREANETLLADRTVQSGVR
mmetsp:Transcript_41471/g.104198  ORF Transcript_41471/g.104198 Transcript_41471/m.104198 type:complete len:109 (+) Transcript_41471:502-828(+)